MSPTEPAACLFDIQHCSLQDGPGIRTSLFFKGCPLRCKWCHNPESWSVQPQLSYQPQHCTGCMACVEVCPRGVHRTERMDGRAVHTLDRENCAVCGRCAGVCHYSALQMVGKPYTVEEILETIRPDRPYYNMEGLERGGITLTGGEPLMQEEFLRVLLPECRDLHICVETCGYVNSMALMELAPRFDLFLFDYKATSLEKHRELCGVDNALILENLRLLYESGANIVLRFPLIPGINDDTEHLQGIADLLKQYPRIQQAEIMPYHNMGEAKGENIGIPSLLPGRPNAGEAQKARWVKSLENSGIKQRILVY